MRRLIFIAAIALASPAFAQEGPTPSPKPTVESLTAEVKRLALVIQVLQAQRNQALAQAADVTAMAEVEKASAKETKPQ